LKKRLKIELQAIWNVRGEKDVKPEVGAQPSIRFSGRKTLGQRKKGGKKGEVKKREGWEGNKNLWASHEKITMGEKPEVNTTTERKK